MPNKTLFGIAMFVKSYDSETKRTTEYLTSGYTWANNKDEAMGAAYRDLEREYPDAFERRVAIVEIPNVRQKGIFGWAILVDGLLCAAYHK